MAVPLGELTRLDSELARGQFLSLVNLKDDRLDGKRIRRGLVMHHSGFNHLNQYEPFWIEDAGLLDQLQGAPAEQGDEVLLPEYQDPLGRNVSEFRQSWMAACASVQVRSRNVKVGRTGWMVILQERP